MNGYDPVQVGVGLGVSQGRIAGLVVGSAVVLAVALSGPRRRAKEPPDRLTSRRGGPLPPRHL